MDVATLIGSTPFVLMVGSFGVPLLSMATKRKGVFDAYAFALTLYAFVSTLLGAVEVLRSEKPVIYTFAGWPPPIGVTYVVDPFSAILGLLTSFVMLMAVVYSWWYAKQFERSAYLYYALILALEAGLLGCLFTSDVFNFFVMMELTCIASYALVAFYRWKLVALEASMKYALIGTAATTLYFLAVVLLYHAFGTLNIADLVEKTRGLEGLVPLPINNVEVLAVVSAVAVSISMWTFMYLSAIFPNHFWLPDAHPEAPTPVSALLSGLVVNLGIYIYARFLYTIFGRGSVLDAAIVEPLGVSVRSTLMILGAVLGGITALLGAMLMSVQNDVKRLLAYSTVSHMGLLFMSLSLGFAASQSCEKLLLEATLFHTLVHGIAKALLFLATGMLIVATGTRLITEWSGVGKLCLPAAVGTIVGALTLLGVPPLAGFFSKLLLVRAYLACGNIYAVVVLVLASVLAIPGYIKLINAVAMGTPSNGKKLGLVATPGYLVLSILVLLCVALGLVYVAGLLDPVLSRAIDLSFGSKGLENLVEISKHVLQTFKP